MKYFFVDESLQTNNKGFSFSVVGGLIVESKFLFVLESELEALKKDYNLSFLKNIKEPGLDSSLRKKFYSELVKILKDYSVNLLCSVAREVDKTFHSEKDGNTKMYLIDSSILAALFLVLERFFLELKNTGTEGLVFYDLASQYEFLSLALHKDSDITFRFKNNKIKKYFPLNVKKFISPEKMKTRIYSLTFLDDTFSNIMQVSDLVVGAVRIAIKNYLLENGLSFSSIGGNVDNLKKYFYALDFFYPFFYRNYAGNVEGYGIKVWY